MELLPNSVIKYAFDALVFDYRSEMQVGVILKKKKKKKVWMSIIS